MKMSLLMAAAAAAAATFATPMVATMIAENAPAVERQSLQVGDMVERDNLHMITMPGRYGLGQAVPGSVYAIVDGQLLRLDAQTHRIQSVIRRVDRIRD